MADRILIVEDDPDDEELVRLALRQAAPGLELEVARDGLEALAALAERPGRFRVVLLDLKLPKLGGLEVLRKLRGGRATRGIPIVVFSSSSSPPDVLASYEAGATSYVAKPVHFERLAETLRRIFGYWLKINQAP